MTQHKRQFTAIIEREGDGYVSLCPELDIASIFSGPAIGLLAHYNRARWARPWRPGPEVFLLA